VVALNSQFAEAATTDCLGAAAPYCSQRIYSQAIRIGLIAVAAITLIQKRSAAKEPNNSKDDNMTIGLTGLFPERILPSGLG
jgi:hypothetical protein